MTFRSRLQEIKDKQKARRESRFKKGAERATKRGGWEGFQKYSKGVKNREARKESREEARKAVFEKFKERFKKKD